MKKAKPINKNQDFKRLYSKGRFSSSALLVTYVMKNRFKYTRVGFTASKKIGNAVQRNRARRVLRASYSFLKNSVRMGTDIVFVARKSTYGAKTQEVLKDMTYQLKKLGVLEWKVLF